MPDREVHTCDRCGSTEVYQMAWVKLNNNFAYAQANMMSLDDVAWVYEGDEAVFDKLEECNFCPDCDANVTVSLQQVDEDGQMLPE